tara:strand:+ start:79 stop:390 length:312 start_codon:yes stop_codon:yes gene_type:complete
MKGTTFLMLLGASVVAGSGAWTYIKSDKDEKSKVHTSVKTHIRNGRIKLAELIKPEEEKPVKAKSTRKPRAKKTTAKAVKANVVVVPDFIEDKSQDASEEVAF